MSAHYSLEKEVYGSGTGSSIFTAPALESTLLIDTGGLDDPNPIGNTPSTAISAAVSSGTRAFQYNRYYYNNDIFSFNYNNGTIGVVIAYYNFALSTFSSIIYMITLPRAAMSLLSSLDKSSPTSDPAQRLILLKELVYYLNIGWTSYGQGENQTFPSSIPARMGPVVYGRNYKGFLPSAVPLVGNTLNNPYMPIFSDTTPPPLLWEICSSNGQLALIKNPAFFTDDVFDLIGYQVVTPQIYFGGAPELVRQGTVFPVTINIPGGFILNNSLNGEKGWCGQGAFATGFAQRKTYTGDTAESFSYNDVYTDTERLDLYNNLHFPVLESVVATPGAFFNYCTTHKLVTDGFLVSNFITSMIPARFYTIESAALTRNQKRPPSSNNPNFINDTVGVVFLTLDKLRTWQDNTISGAGSSRKSALFPARKSGTDDTSILFMDPMQSLQVLDILIRDEWGNIIQNYTELIESHLTFVNSFLGVLPSDEYLLGFVEGLYFAPNTMTIPAWVAAYNPVTTGGNTESILLNENWWANWCVLFILNSNETKFSPINADTTRSSTMVHFGRVLGH